ncbi:MAG: MmcQ/YjbR family DNA-binding protein [Clostridiales bacterium]|nr:MmcQ/YjbR family DNA-binding protein [Clostridiales bacterium]
MFIRKEAQPITRQEIIDYCLTFPAAYEDYPFDEMPGEDSTTVMRHRTNKKSFALIMNHNGKLHLNLKCDPLEADFLRQAFKGVMPGWHMNKEHWNSVVLGMDVPEDEIKRQIENSYDLIKPKLRKRNGDSKKPER